MFQKSNRNFPGTLSLAVMAVMICFLYISVDNTGAGGKATGSGSKPDVNIPGYGHAENNPDRDEMRRSIARLESRALELQQEIVKMRDNALDNNPALDILLKDLVLTTDTVMSRNLEKENVDLEQLQLIEKQLQDPEISPERKAQLEQKKRKAFLGYKKAEMRTDRDETLGKLREEFYTKLMAASKKENPNAEEILEELDIIQHQLRFVKPEAMPEKQQSKQ